ncbi:hypothetical protein [Sphingomonas profundi]|uniref:hypothetical protein n=1 Tax=Alterirhizorhabdus profundi TaxID=2681549 RepID=UPI0012E737CD|nr:hypothetical protein [Sphingomonas profundi]
MTFVRRVAACCAFLGMIGAVPANAACWADRTREAVNVRELQTMLMVASLRCHAAGIDILADYNGFMQASRGAIEAANLEIKGHFAAEGGGQADYDRFTTLLANSYGDDATDPAACAEAAGTAHEIAAAPDQLHRLASARIFPRLLPGGACGVPARGAEMAVIAAPKAVVRLPEDVAAALAVMARYGGGAPAVSPSPPTRLAAVAP